MGNIDEMIGVPSLTDLEQGAENIASNFDPAVVEASVNYVVGPVLDNLSGEYKPSEEVCGGDYMSHEGVVCETEIDFCEEIRRDVNKKVDEWQEYSMAHIDEAQVKANVIMEVAQAKVNMAVEVAKSTIDAIGKAVMYRVYLVVMFFAD